MINVFHRRIGRTGYLIGLVASTLLLMPLYKSPSAPLAQATDPTWLLVATIGYAYVNIVLAAWRCHDFGKSGWHDFWNNQIPFIGWAISLLELLAKPGEPHMNSYGHPPWI